MPQLPKFVSERLRVAGTAGNHPDPNVLTAFSERLLPVPERAVVMEHLARCGDCREVVALALPAIESAAMPGLIEHRPWFRGAVLRWGVAVASVVAVAAVGIQQYRERHQSQMVAMVADRMRLEQNEAASDKLSQSDAALNDRTKDETGASQPAAAPKSQSREEASDPARTAARLVGQPSRERVARSQSRSFGSGKAAAGSGGGIGAGMYAYSSRQGTKLAMNTPPQPLFPGAELKAGSPAMKQLGSYNTPKPSAHSMPETVEVQAEGAQAVAQEPARSLRPDQKLDLDREQRQQANAEPAGAAADRVMSKAKPPTVQAGYGSVPVAPAPPADSVQAAGARTLSGRGLAWTISSDGGLQRSFDGGKTWQTVDVGSSVIAGNASMQIETVIVAKESAKPNRNRLAKPAGAAAVFRAVAATESDVWAGGSGGALYHSTDSGDHWTRIFPSVDSVFLTADITSIQSIDLQHITIDTADSEKWSTDDAGRSWQRH